MHAAVHGWTSCSGARYSGGYHLLSHELIMSFSIDLRRKVVEAVQRGMSKAQAARALGVGISSVKW